MFRHTGFVCPRDAGTHDQISPNKIKQWHYVTSARFLGGNLVYGFPFSVQPTWKIGFERSLEIAHMERAEQSSAAQEHEDVEICK